MLNVNTIFILSIISQNYLYLSINQPWKINIIIIYNYYILLYIEKSNIKKYDSNATTYS